MGIAREKLFVKPMNLQALVLFANSRSQLMIRATLYSLGRAWKRMPRERNPGRLDLLQLNTAVSDAPVFRTRSYSTLPTSLR